VHATAYSTARAYAITAIARFDLRLSILFENDFADLFEVRGSRRERRGTATAKLAAAIRCCSFITAWTPKERRHGVELRSAAGSPYDNRRSNELHLEPGEMRPIFLAASCDQPTRVRCRPPAASSRPAGNARADARAHVLETSNTLQEILCRSAADLAI